MPLLYACTIACSSLLLLLVQPMIAKALLPWFGGAAGVWVTAMLFFQVMLLLGYLYAHWTTEHLTPRRQAGLHLFLLAASVLALPIVPSAAWKPVTAADPLWRILGALGVSVGLPYFLLSTTGPLVQTWFARRTGTAFPYRLFAISNAASLAALLAYPVVIEPFLSTHHQLTGWSAAYAGFILLAGAAAFLSRVGATAPRPAEATAPPAASERLLWIALAACPSVLWLGVANTLSQDVAPIPLLWILPLGIYLLSFILCFDRPGWYRPKVFRIALPAAWILTGYALAGQGATIGIRATVALFCAGLFTCCMFCHGELARRKPPAGQLTSYYLMLAVGGALGGLFVALAAPNLFHSYLELQVGVVGCVILAMALLYHFRPRQVIRISLTATVAFILAVQARGLLEGGLVHVRNFYGCIQVSETGTGDAAMRTLKNGPICHGSQFLSPDRSRLATTYFGPDSGIGLTLGPAPEHPRRVGVIGLGAGTIASYGRPGDEYRFYEINPAVIQIARSEFRYLSECRGKVDVVYGDGRLALERDPGRTFDVLVLDAFSGDSIPTHLLSREAFAMYFSHLSPDGILAAHVTNRFVDLTTVVRALANDAGKPSRLIRNADDDSRGILAADWVLVTSNREFLGKLDGLDTPFPSVPPRRTWTDDYSNLFQALK